MSKGFMCFMKGAGIGMTVGCFAGAVCVKCMGGHHNFKKSIGRALHNMGELVENVTDMF